MISHGFLPPAVLPLLRRIHGHLEEVYLLSSSHDLWASAADMHQRYRRVSRPLCPSAAEAGGVALKLNIQTIYGISEVKGESQGAHGLWAPPQTSRLAKTYKAMVEFP